MGGRTDVDMLVLLGIEREGDRIESEMSQISDWKDGEQGRMTMTLKLGLGIR